MEIDNEDSVALIATPSWLFYLQIQYVHLSRCVSATKSKINRDSNTVAKSNDGNQRAWDRKFHTVHTRSRNVHGRSLHGLRGPRVRPTRL